ncbi:unnamed protein product [Lymnaea stagnalis]|uniref:SAM domain-containing protein n=1 Tax=Lymnaea stagnalis TaxID=6523 RepID=A0AAV2H664_LYMST
MAERFIDAAKDGYMDLLREATRKDLNTPDEDGMTATLWAADKGNLEALRLIVGREGDVDRADYLGMTALHHAAMRGHMGVVSYLVHWGCNIFAVDNDLHSALDIASMYDRAEIVRYLDNVVAERQRKNPKQVSRLKEEAIKAAENNIKRYERLQEAATKRAEKEQKRRQKEIEEGVNGDARPKKSFIQHLTMRIKGNPSSLIDKGSASQRKYSNFATASGSGGLAKKIQMRRLESLAPTNSDFKISNMDERGNRSVRSVGQGQGYYGSTSEVLYMVGNMWGKEEGEDDGRGFTKRPPLSADVFQRNMYRARSEPDLLADSGVDSFNGEDDDDDQVPSMLNRPEFGRIAFLSKNPFLTTVQSLDDNLPLRGPGDALDEFSNRDDVFLSDDRNDFSAKRQSLPWDQDDLGNLDDDEEESTELSAINMFLWTCGMAGYFHIFAQEKIDMTLLAAMTDNELKDLGIPFGPRKKLKDAIARRKAVLDSPNKMVDTVL